MQILGALSFTKTGITYLVDAANQEEHHRKAAFEDG